MKRSLESSGISWVVSSHFLAVQWLRLNLLMQGLWVRSLVRELRSHMLLGFPGGSDGEESACNVGDLGSIPGLGRSPGGGYSNPHQYSCLENPMDRGAWWATVHGSQRVGHD